MDQEQLDDFQDKIENNLYSTLENFALFQSEMMIDEKIKEFRKEMKCMKEELENEFIYEIYKAKKEIREQVISCPKVSKKSFWKWWKR
jgi:hypothetical protein